MRFLPHHAALIAGFSRANDAIVPVICPTCQMVRNVPAKMPAAPGYCAWGCFRYLVGWAYGRVRRITGSVIHPSKFQRAEARSSLWPMPIARLISLM
jgi:hypothetical protein